jgi:hypothetical protein
MNKISLCGLLPYLICSIYYHSYGMILIYINGLLFHNFPNSKIFYTIDFGTNTFLFIYSTINYPFVFKYMMFAFISFLINSHYFKNHKRLCEVNHVIFVQWVGLYAMLNVYKTNNCFPLLFDC